MEKRRLLVKKIDVEEKILCLKKIIKKFSTSEGEKTLAEFNNVIALALEVFGFTAFTLTTIGLCRCKQLSTLPDGDKTINNLTEIVKEYFENEYKPKFLSDIKRYVDGYPFCSSRIYKCQSDIYKLVKSGFSETYIVCYHDEKGSKYLLAVYSQYMEPDTFRIVAEEYHDYLHKLLELIIPVGVKKFPDYFVGVVRSDSALLKPKPVKLLALVGKEGLTLSDAADRLGVKLDTVNRYCMDLKKTTGCKSIEQVIHYVYSQRLIDPSDITAMNPPEIFSVHKQPKQADSDSRRSTITAKEELDTNQINTRFQSIYPLSQCTEIDEFKESIRFFLVQLGFTDFYIEILNTPSDKHLTTLPDDVVSFLMQEDFVHVDFCREHVASYGGPVFLSSMRKFIKKSALRSKRILWNAAYFQLLANFGYVDSYCISNNINSSTNRAMFLVFAKNDNQKDFYCRVNQNIFHLSVLFESIMSVGVRNFPQNFSPIVDKDIGEKQLNVSKAIITEGLSQKVVASRFYVSEFTVPVYIEFIKNHLGATSRKNLAYLAWKYNIFK